MLVDYDAEGDSLTVSFEYRERLGVGRPLDIRRILLYGQDGDFLGVEFLAATRGVDLKDIPRANEIAAAVNTLKDATSRVTVAAMGQ